MLKKAAAISAIVLAICLIAFFALSPLAISDSVALAQQMAPSYAVMSELSQYSAEDIEAVTLTGYWGNSLEVRPSADNKIRILTDNYSVSPPVFRPRSSDDGTLEVYCIFTTPSPITLLTRENIQRLIVASLNNKSLNRIVLELPASVAFKVGEYDNHYYYNIFIDERVTVFQPDEKLAQEDKANIVDGDEIVESNKTIFSDVTPEL